MSEGSIYILALMIIGGLCVLFALGIIVLLVVCVIADRYADARNKGHINATLFRFGLHFFTLSREQNRRFVHNAKLAGYKIKVGKRIAVGLELPVWVIRIIKRKRGGSDA